MVDKFGRRHTIMFALGGQSVCLFVLADVVGVSTATVSAHTIDAWIFFLLLFFAFFATSMLGIPRLYQTEINSSHMRGPVAAAGTAISYLLNFVFAITFPRALASLGWRFITIFASFAVVSILIVY